MESQLNRLQRPARSLPMHTTGKKLPTSLPASNAMRLSKPGELSLKISSRTVRANGIRQHYVTAGDGPPVVLLHGFPETSYAWRHQLPELAKKYRVIAPDLRGYG